MAANVQLTGSLSIKESLYGEIKEKDTLEATLSSLVIERIEKDYNNLVHRPSINGMELIGDKTSENLKISQVITKESHLFFPNVGSENNIYIDKKNNRTFRWDPIIQNYIIIGSNYEDLQVIKGGDAYG